ncbi:MAG: WGR domain-containing protein [Candidatus Sericytochromatia bacterium]
MFENINNLYLELSDGKHHKFYELVKEKNIIAIFYGRIGRKGTTKIIEFANNKEALKFFDKKIIQKIKKGYKKSLKGLNGIKDKNFNSNQLRLPFIEFFS